MNKPIILQQCQLCDDFAVLRKSHIAPRFMEMYVKSVSLTKQFTTSQDFNRDSQSTYKEYFLCHSCEQMFCLRESEFARHIFWPWIKEGYVHTEKTQWLEYFLVSITWRFARYHERNQARLNNRCEVCTSPALQNLKDYLLGRTQSPGAFAPRLFYSKVEDCTAEDDGAIAGPTPLFDYLTRCFNQMIGFETHGLGLIAYVKVPHFAIWHTIHGPEFIIDDNKIMEIGVSQANKYALEQIEKTTAATRARRDQAVSKHSQQELQDFYGSPMGDNVLRAQQFLTAEKQT